MVIFDTSVIIDHLRAHTDTASFFEQLIARHPKQSGALSIFSVQEFFAGKSTHNPNMEEKLLATISPLTILSYDWEIAVAAGKLNRDTNISFADAAIAATAIKYEATLATLNTKDFAKIPGLILA